MAEYGSGGSGGSSGSGDAEERRRRRRPSKGNVIYANFGNKTRVSTPPAETPGRPARGGAASRPRPPARNETRRVRGEDYAQEFLRGIYHDFTDPGRISRGIGYARNGNVVTFSVAKDRVMAEVAGSQNEPFSVVVNFPHRSAADIEEVTAELLREPGALADARRGLLTRQMVNILFAFETSDVRISCDCPDGALCCKHGVAVLETFAERLERDPALAFKLRALNFAMLEQSMQARAKQDAENAAQHADPEKFWNGGELPALPSPKLAPAIDDSDLDALHQVMRTITYGSIDELRAVSDIEELYDYLVDR